MNVIRLDFYEFNNNITRNEDIRTSLRKLYRKIISRQRDISALQEEKQSIENRID